LRSECHPSILPGAPDRQVTKYHPFTREYERGARPSHYRAAAATRTRPRRLLLRGDVSRLHCRVPPEARHLLRIRVPALPLSGEACLGARPDATGVRFSGRNAARNFSLAGRTPAVL
jgi:hypothetical protein